MDEFEYLLEAERASVERLVRFRISNQTDAEDVIQEIYLAAFQKYSQLKNKDSGKAWLISIARNKCNDYFRQKAPQTEVSMGDLEGDMLPDSRHGVSSADAVQETFQSLGQRDREILYLYFWKELPQADISQKLNIPLGTVKSRLHTAKQNFRNRYPYHTQIPKGTTHMKKLPEYIPFYRIEKSSEPPFSIKWEELMGWFLVPKLGETLTWGMYEIPSRRCSHVYDMQVTGKAKVHGIEGVEITAREASYTNKEDVINRTFVAQLTDTHCRYLAALRNDGDVRNYITFLDGDEFMPNWGFGENNCGNETNLSPKGDIRRTGDTVTSKDKDFLLDIVGRYTVTIGEKSYDTVCVMDIETYNCGVLSEQFIDRNGRTVLWRRFNRDDWAMDRYRKKWGELLPDNDRITVNGTTFVHWYDCITDYIL